MAGILGRLLDVAQVCVISGGQFGQFESQLIARLPAEPASLERLQLMPTCGTRYYASSTAPGRSSNAEDLSADEKSRALAAVESEARRLGLWEPANEESTTWGEILEDRGSQITFSALGQSAPVDAKKAWDPTGAKKNALRSAVQELLPDLEVRSGGSTSVDITRRGIDKAYGMTRLAQITGIPFGDMLFVGDRLDPDGNDYPVSTLGIRCIAVEGWEDTAGVVERFLEGYLPESGASERRDAPIRANSPRSSVAGGTARSCTCSRTAHQQPVAEDDGGDGGARRQQVLALILDVEHERAVDLRVEVALVERARIPR